MHVSDKLPKLHCVSIVLLSVGIILLGEALLDDSARLKQTVGDDTGIALGKVLIPHRERRERAVRYKAVHAGVGYGVCFIRCVGYANRLSTDKRCTGKADSGSEQLLPAGEPDANTAHDIAANHVYSGSFGYSANRDCCRYAKYRVS